MKINNKLKAMALVVSVFLVSVSATSDTTDMGGQAYRPTSPCPEGSGTLYRYIARTLGGRPRIDEFCTSQDYVEEFINHPTEEMQGSCSEKYCGHAATSRRGPIEHALFQAVASLERSKATRIQVMTATYETRHAGYDTGVNRSLARFQLDPNSHCITELMSYNENDSSEYDDLNRSTITNGIVWVEQKYVNSTYNLLIMVEVEYDGIYEAEFFREIISCQSTTGPILAQKLSAYDFKVMRVNLQEWMIHVSSATRR